MVGALQHVAKQISFNLYSLCDGVPLGCSAGPTAGCKGCGAATSNDTQSFAVQSCGRVES